MTRAADALRPGGSLVTLGNHHVQGEDGGFSTAVQDCYLRSGRFEAPSFLRHPWAGTYDSQAFADLLATFSDVRSMDEDARTGLLTCISSLIDVRFGAQVVKHHLAHARVARRLRSPAAVGWDRSAAARDPVLQALPEPRLGTAGPTISSP